MTDYAVHHDWIDGCATQVPVGVWDEWGQSHYPPSTAHLKPRGHRASSRPASRTWAQHLTYLTDTSSAYNANWAVVSSEWSKEETMEALWHGFLASEPPTVPLKFEAPVEDEYGDGTDAPEELSPEPAERFLLAHTWWIVSEFVRRHPDWAIRFGDHLSYLTLIGPQAETRRIVANPGTIHLFGQNSTHKIIRHPLSMADAHEAVKAIERFVGDPPHRRTPVSTPRTLAYRLLATILNITVNDRARWEIRNEIGGEDGYGDGPVRAGIVSQFADAARDARALGSDPWDLGEPLRHFWAILRDEHPVAVISTEGRAYLSESTVELQPAYETNGRSMLRLVAELFGDLLP